MNYSVYNIRLDLHKSASQACLITPKHDTKRKIVITLTENNKPYEIAEGCYAVFTAKKADGKVIYNDCVIENNRVVYAFTEQTAASEGVMNCQIELYGTDSELISSPSFVLTVFPKVYDGEEEIESANEFTALQKLITEVNDMLNDGALRGDDGVSVTNASVNETGELVVTLSDGNEINAGFVKGEPGRDGTDGRDGQDGKNGEPVTVTGVTESTLDGGSNIVEFSDGKTLTVKNGSKGSPGRDGSDGEDGADGVSVTKVEQTVTSGSDGGENVVTISLSDGTQHTVKIKNGSKGAGGDQGLPGQDGTSVTVTNVSESTADGGSNVVYFSDGKTLTVKNGRKGADGSDGSDGADGVSVSSVVQTTTANTDGGENVITVTLSNGNKSTFKVKNGTKGSQGLKGDPGKGLTVLGYYSTKLLLESSVTDPEPGDTYGVGTAAPYNIYMWDAEKGWVDNGQLQGAKGEDGISVTGATINADGELILSFSDGDDLNVGRVVGADGADGSDGAAGKDGTSVTVTNVSESTEDGGSNVVTFSNGSKLTVKNGQRGSDGTDGTNGKDGAAGKDGTSVTVTNVSESTADGGSNVVTFSDGKTLTVKNGSKGSAGKDGSNGTNGADGVSITKVEQTTTSSADGGENVITVTFSNGNTSTFKVKNGSKGSTGDPGSDATVTKAAVEAVLTGDITTHVHSQYVSQSNNVLSSKVIAQNGTDHSTLRVRNVAIVAKNGNAPTGGDGDIYFTYG